MSIIETAPAPKKAREKSDRHVRAGKLSLAGPMHVTKRCRRDPLGRILPYKVAAPKAAKKVKK
jgi:hypothetical protein